MVCIVDGEVGPTSAITSASEKRVPQACSEGTQARLPRVDELESHSSSACTNSEDKEVPTDTIRVNDVTAATECRS